MRSILTGVILLISLSLCCEKDETKPPASKPEQLASNAYNYVIQHVYWINRDSWSSTDGTSEHWSAISYNKHETDWWNDFIEKIDSSKVPNQIKWSEYTSYHPGGRSTDGEQDYDWAGTRCQGLVYKSAIESGYIIASYPYLDFVNCWENLGTEVIIPQEGDLFLMDFDTTNNHPEVLYEHMGIMWGGLPSMLSAVAIYSDPFWFKAGIHTEARYDTALAAEFPDLHLKVYNIKYIRLSE